LVPAYWALVLQKEETVAKEFLVSFQGEAPWKTLKIEADTYEYDEQFVTFKLGQSGKRNKLASFDRRIVLAIQNQALLPELLETSDSKPTI